MKEKVKSVAMIDRLMEYDGRLLRLHLEEIKEQAARKHTPKPKITLLIGYHHSCRQYCRDERIDPRSVKICCMKQDIQSIHAEDIHRIIFMYDWNQTPVSDDPRFHMLIDAWNRRQAPR